MAHRLQGALSPYLRQHQDNPVDWWQWGDDAFAEARRRDVPVLLSVGYAACHWCHVMAHESFEDETTAAFMNDRFVSIKVDREERPDVDAVYMAATQALTGRGGWPMTVFLDHDARPFYAGTYFPPQPRHGMPSFMDVLSALDEAWRTDRERVLRASAHVESALAEASLVDGPGAGSVAEPGRASAPASRGPGPGASGASGRTGAQAESRASLSVRASVASPGPAPASVRDVHAAVDRLSGDFDPVHGGFGGAPKFPPTPVLEFLLRAHALSPRRGDRALGMAMTTLGAMARGGVFDQLAGGFARYSVDAEWVVPHFEKMLSDNAQLLRVYLHAWRATGDPLARRVATQTAEFLLNELGTPEGGFASSLDADSREAGVGGSEGGGMGGPDFAEAVDADGGVLREGAYYVWTPEQLSAVLGAEDGAWFARLTSVTLSGTFERGSSVLQMRRDADDPARWEACRERLAQARSRRPRPARDDKVVASWNGLAIAALAEAGALLNRPEWIAAARHCADLLVAVHWSGEQRTLRRVSLGGLVGDAMGVLSDYADVAEGMLALYQVTGEERWFGLGRDLVEVILERFPDGRGGFFDTDSTAPRLVRRPQDPGDGVAASGWTSAANALITLAALTGENRYRAAGERALEVLIPLARRNPRFLGWGWAALSAVIAGPMQVAVVLPREEAPDVLAPNVIPAEVTPDPLAPDPLTPDPLPAEVTPDPLAPDPFAPDLAALPSALALTPLHLTALRSTSPGLVVAVATEGESMVPLLRDRRSATDGRPTAYPCRGFVCDLPVTDESALQRSLSAGVAEG